MTEQTHRRAQSLGQAAHALGVSIRTLERLAKAGGIRVVKVSPRRRVVPTDEVDRILAGNATA